MLRGKILIPLALISYAAQAGGMPADRFFPEAKVSARASSELKEKNKPANFYSAAKATDNSVLTSWCVANNEATGGVGEWIEINFKPIFAEKIGILNGYGATGKLYKENNRVTKVKIDLTTKAGKIISLTETLDSAACKGDMKSMGDSDKEACSEFTAAVGNDVPNYAVVNFDKLCIQKAKITILEIKKGGKHNDTCISEVALGENFSFDKTSAKSCK